MIMNKLLHSVSDIEKSIEKIAYAVTCVFRDAQNEESFKAFYDFYYDKLKKSKFFFLENRLYYNRYEKELHGLLKQLSDIIGYDVSEYILNKENSNMTVNVLKNRNAERPEELVEMYKKDKNKYNSFSINFSTLLDVYLAGGQAKIDELNSLIQLINKKISFYTLKSYLSSVKESFSVSKIIKDIDKLCAKYKIDNFRDLLSFNTEIDSFFVKKNELNDKQSIIIENNKNSFRKRIGEKDNFELPKKSALKLKEKINKLYNSNMYEEVIKNTNIEEFLEINDIKLNDFKVEDIMFYYMHLLECRAFATEISVNDKKIDVCMIQPCLLDEESIGQNTTILHESIHFLQSRVPKGNGALSIYCKYMTEAMTEYFALEARKHLKGDILTFHNNENKYKGSVYDCMLPLVEVLTKCDKWKDFISAYICNDTYFLVKRIGDSSLNKIKECFDVVFENRKSRNIDVIVDKSVKNLDKVLKNINKTRI